MYKERKKKFTKKESGKEALNINHKAYNVRLPLLQLIMGTHAQLSQLIPKEWLKIQ